MANFNYTKHFLNKIEDLYSETEYNLRYERGHFKSGYCVLKSEAQSIIEEGKVLFEVVRKRPKRFFQRKPDGQGGWSTNVRNVRKVLYRLPELLKADFTQPVFIVEGEKDVDRLRREGLIATENQ